jgi:steroid delta-isomerase-like uncharacterized protein
MQAMADNDLKNVVRKLYAAFNTGDLRSLDALVADAFVEHEDTPGIPPTKDGLKQFVVMLRQALPDALFEVADIASELDKVWTRVVVTGTQRGTYFGIPPTGKTIRIEVFDICRIARNQITEHWGLSDQMGVMRQLGVVAGPSS